MSREGNLKGAQRELRVSLDLMSKGFEVFRPMHPTSCDILALKHGLTLRIEVKGMSGHTGKSPSGPVAMLYGGSGGNKGDCRKFDVLVRVSENNELFYQRSVLHSSNKASADLPLREEINSRTTLKIRKKMENPCQP